MTTTCQTVYQAELAYRYSRDDEMTVYQTSLVVRTNIDAEVVRGLGNAQVQVENWLDIT